MTSITITGIRAQDTHRNHSHGFFTNKEAHAVFIKAITRQSGASTKLHKKAISKAIKSRQQKGWDFINSDGPDGRVIQDTITHKITQTPATNACQTILSEETRYIAVNKPIK